MVNPQSCRTTYDIAKIFIYWHGDEEGRRESGDEEEGMRERGKGEGKEWLRREEGGRGKGWGGGANGGARERGEGFVASADMIAN